MWSHLPSSSLWLYSSLSWASSANSARAWSASSLALAGLLQDLALVGDDLFQQLGVG